MIESQRNKEPVADELAALRQRVSELESAADEHQQIELSLSTTKER